MVIIDLSSRAITQVMLHMIVHLCAWSKCPTAAIITIANLTCFATCFACFAFLTFLTPLHTSNYYPHSWQTGSLMGRGVGHTVHSVQGPTTYSITDGKRSKTVHVNQLQRRIQPDPKTPSQELITTWQPPLFHLDIASDDPPPEPRYPTCICRPPDRLQL